MRRCVLFPLLLAGAVLWAVTVWADDDLPLWDSAVNRLLAAGLYGLETGETNSARVGMEDTRDLYRGLAADKARLHGQAITFSYEGSSGLLGFSAGYIYTSGAQDGRMGAVYLDIDDPLGFKAMNRTDAWYLALNLSTSYQPRDDISLGLAGRTMLMKDPYDAAGRGRMVSFLLNMPVSYKKYITITPELQWSRSLPGFSGRDNRLLPAEEDDSDRDVFYGGVSISFSY